MKNLLERFALQADAFQESFAHMCKSRSVDQLARNFFQVLRGNLLIISGSMYFRSAAEDAWRPLYATNHQTV